MVEEVHIRYQLTLALRLLDTASRAMVFGPEVSLFRNGEPVRAAERGGGCLVLTGYPREDFTLGIQARGFEPAQVPVRFEKLDRQLPQLTVHLVPGSLYRSPAPLVTVRGDLPDVKSLTAVQPGAGTCFVRDYDARKRLLTVFNPHRLELDRVYYGLAKPEEGTFEPFSILGRRPSEQYELYRIDHPLETEPQPNFPICPIVFGAADETGCRLTFREEGGPPLWIFRWETGQGVFFKAADIRRREALTIP